jgi:hypothetical protein
MAGLYRLVLARLGLEVRSDRRQQAHPARCTAVMALISASWRYILSTPLVVGEGKALRVLVTVVLFWPPSRLAEGATPLARAWVVVQSTVRILSASGAGSSGRAATIVFVPMSLFRHCAVSCSALGCQVRACTRCPS